MPRKSRKGTTASKRDGPEKRRSSRRRGHRKSESEEEDSASEKSVEEQVDDGKKDECLVNNEGNKGDESGSSDGAWQVRSENGNKGGIPKLKLCLHRPPEISSPTSEPLASPRPRRSRRGASPVVSKTDENHGDEPTLTSSLDEQQQRTPRKRKTVESHEEAKNEEGSGDVVLEHSVEVAILPEVVQTEEPTVVEDVVQDIESENAAHVVEKISCSSDQGSVFFIKEVEAEERQEEKNEEVNAMETNKQEEPLIEDHPREATPEHVQEEEMPRLENTVVEEKRRKRSPSRDSSEERAKEAALKSRKSKKKEGSEDGEVIESPERDVAFPRRTGVRIKTSGSKQFQDISKQCEETTAPVVRKRRWGSSSSKVEKKPILSISTDVLKEIIPEAKPVPLDEVQLSPNGDIEDEEGEVESMGRKNSYSGEKPRNTGRRRDSVTGKKSREHGERKDSSAEEKSREPVERRDSLTDEKPREPVGRSDSLTDEKPREPIGRKRENLSDESEKDYEEEGVDSGGEDMTKKRSPKAVRRLSTERTKIEAPALPPFKRTPSFPSDPLFVKSQQRSPSPAKNPPSCVLYIANLTRPFTVGQLKDLLTRTGSIVDENGFWIDKIKSRCFVKYASEEEAKTTRHALHGISWPASNPKRLLVDYGTEEGLKAALVDGKAPPVVKELARPISRILEERREREVERKRDIEKEGVRDRDRVKEKDKERERQAVLSRRIEKERKPDTDRDELRRPVRKVTIPVREWDLGKTERGFSPPPPPTNNRYDEVDDDRRRHRERMERDRARRSPSDEPVRKVKRKSEEAPKLLLDDLFRKTKATPSIYWLPLSSEQIAVREEMRRKHMAEHEKKIAELQKKHEGRRRKRSRSRSRSRSPKK